MKKILATALLVISPLVFADATPRAGAEAAAYAAKACTTECLILTQRDLAQLQANVQAIAEEAFVKGAEAALEAVKNNPKICPRNV